MLWKESVVKLSIPQLAVVLMAAVLCDVASAQYYPQVPSGPYRPWTATPSYAPQPQALPQNMERLPEEQQPVQEIQQVSTHPVAENLLTTPEAKQALAEQPSPDVPAEVIAADSLNQETLSEPQANILATSTSTRRTKSFEQRIAEIEAQLVALETPVPMAYNCNSCNDCGVSCGCDSKKECKTGGVVAGFDLVFVTPYFEENTAFTLNAPSGAGGFDNNTVSFEYDMALAPRAYVGYEFAGGLGARGRYFQYDQDANPRAFVSDAVTEAVVLFQRSNFPGGGPIDFGTAPISFITGPGTTIRAESDLSVEIIDVEITKRLSGDGWEMLLAGGLRYMKLEQMYRVRSEFAPAGFFNDLRIDRDFDGLGPSGALRIAAPVGETNLGVFANMRGSLLFGQNKQFYFADADNFLGPDTLTLENDDVIGILELQLGTEYSYRLENGMRLFANVAGEGQLWMGAGSAFNQDNAGSEADGNFGLVGFTVGGGIAR